MQVAAATASPKTPEATTSLKPSDPLSTPEAMARVDGACALVGAELTMTLDDTKDLIDVSIVYKCARDEGADLVLVVWEVAV